MTIASPEYWMLVAAISVSTVFAVYMAARRPQPTEAFAGDVVIPDGAVLVCPPPTEDEEIAMSEEYEQGVLPLQVKNHPELVRRLRVKARELAAGGREITSDDIHDVFPIPAGVDPRVMGAVFHPKEDWVRVGWQKSRRKENHGRTVARWMLKQAVAA